LDTDRMLISCNGLIVWYREDAVFLRYSVSTLIRRSFPCLRDVKAHYYGVLFIIWGFFLSQLSYLTSWLVSASVERYQLNTCAVSDSHLFVFLICCRLEPYFLGTSGWCLRLSNTATVCTCVQRNYLIVSIAWKDVGCQNFGRYQSHLSGSEMATTDGILVLSNGVGYGIVVGIGAFFALLM